MPLDFLLDFSKSTPAELARRGVTEFAQSPFAGRVGAFLREWVSDSPFFEARTSGTTGPPKDLLLKKSVAAACAERSLDFLLPKSRGGFFLMCLDPQFIAGKMMLARGFAAGAKVLCREPTAEKLILPGERFDLCAMVSNQAARNLSGLNRLKRLLLGGGPLHPALEEKILEAAANPALSYGMTETYSHVAFRSLEKIESPEGPPSEGRKRYDALPGVEFSRDAKGRLVIRDVLSSPEPLLTDDLAEVPNGTTFFWKGRDGNAILSGGYKIRPEELEERLGLFLNCEFFFGGVPDEKLGFKNVLFLEDAPRVPSAEAIRFALNRACHKLERPKLVFVAESFARTASGKINRKKTLKTFAAGRPSFRRFPLG